MKSLTENYKLKPRSKSKYRAIATIIDNIRFASKKEAKRYEELKALQKEGSIKYFLRQAPFHLNCGSKYICDFLVVWAEDYGVTIEDVKGIKTDIYKLKKKMVESEYPIKITEI